MNAVIDTDMSTIDVELALERAGGNPELAKELFGMLMGELPSFRSNIEHHFQSHDRAQLQEVVHKLNGAATYCGVPLLKERANILESRLKAGEDPSITPLLEAIDAVLSEGRNGIPL